MPNFAELIDKLPDDAEVDFGGEAGKVKVADIKGHIGTYRTAAEQRAAEVQAAKAEVERLRGFEKDFSALAGQAARLAAMEQQQDNARAQNGNGGTPEVDAFTRKYGNDPVLGTFAQEYEEKLISDLDAKYFKPWMKQQLEPILTKQQQENDLLRQLAFDLKQREDFREAGEWPEEFNVQKAREVGKQKGYFIRGGEGYGLVDMKRVREEVYAPIERKRWEDQVRQKAEEEAAQKLRMHGVIVDMPNRTMGGAPKKPIVKGVGGDVIGNALAQAGEDLETQRMLANMRR